MNQEIDEKPIKIWSERPSPQDIVEITDIFEANCIIEDKDPKTQSRNLEAMTAFLNDQNMGSLTRETIINYIDSMRNLLEERYPRDEQIEMDLK